MNEKELACCVVRDLLPSYIEGLTEAETTALVAEHMENCSDCRKIEQDMRHTIPVEKPIRRELKFLRRIRRTRLIAAVLTGIVTLLCMWWLYDMEFHYPDTEAGHLAAVEDYIPSPEDDSSIGRVEAGTPLHAGASVKKDCHLFIFYFADNEQSVHGIVHLVRGINGKYRILESKASPSDYSGGIYVGNLLTPKGMDQGLYYIAGYNCRDIYRAEVELWGGYLNGAESHSAVKTFELSGENFLQLMDQKTLAQELGFPEEGLAGIDETGNEKLFDREGKDITGEYTSESGSASWGSGTGTAELFLIYVYMGIVAWLGIVLIRYFLRKD